MATDVVGFTPLSERLAQAGRIGAEVVGSSMDRCFGALIDAIEPYGGDVLFFGGDALFLVFRGGDHARHGVDGALAMLAALRSVVPLRTPLGTVRISMSIGVATGVAEVVVGDGPQRPLFIVGPTVTRTAHNESKAQSGEVRIDAATFELIGKAGASPAEDGAWVVTRRRPHPAPDEPPTLDPPLPPSGRADLHVSAHLRASLLAGDAPREHRHVAIAFLKIRELDDVGSAERATILATASDVVGAACAAFDVCWVETDVARDGATIVIAAGVPQQHDDDELRLAAAVRRIADSLGDRVSIGMHRGTAFAGDVGHQRRRTYAVTGLTTITAARLMGNAAPGEVLASADVIDRLQQRYDAGPRRELAVKGRRQIVPAHSLGSLHPPPAARREAKLVGRRDELAVLNRALARHEAGRGSTVEIVGTPGMGKSALLRAFLTTAPAPRVTIGGDVALSVVPFAALVAPLRNALGATTARKATTAAKRVGDLAPLLGPVLDLNASRHSGVPRDRGIVDPHRSCRARRRIAP